MSRLNDCDSLEQQILDVFNERGYISRPYVIVRLSLAEDYFQQTPNLEGLNVVVVRDEDFPEVMKLVKEQRKKVDFVKLNDEPE